MLIAINDCGRVTLPRGNVLGHIEENKLRTHTVIHPKFENAYYNLVLDYGNNTQKVLQVADGVVTMERTMLPEEGEVKAQFRAVAIVETEACIFKSDIFTVRILPSL